MTKLDYETFLAQHAPLQKAVVEHCRHLQIPAHHRVLLSFKAGSLSLQLATATMGLMRQGNAFAAIALIRPQFECLVRGTWLMYVARDHWIEKLSQPLTLDSTCHFSSTPSSHSL